MKVQAKCTARAWDSVSATMLYPGGGTLENGDYEIERDGQLAQLKNAMGAYIFQFDRNAAPGEIKDYTCKKCEKPFKTLAELGNHTNSEHPVGSDSVVEEEPVFADRTCDICQKVCRSPYGLKVHKRKAHEEQEAEVAA